MPPAVPVPTPTEAALRQLLERGEARLRGFVGKLCRGAGTVGEHRRCDPDDVVQDTMARAWRYRESLDPGQDGVPWLLRIAFRVYLDHAGKPPGPVLLGDIDGGDLEPECSAPSGARSTEGQDEVAALVRELKPIEQAVLLGFHRDGKSLQELAAQHGLGVNTIKSHLHRARLQLRQKGEPS